MPNLPADTTMMPLTVPSAVTGHSIRNLKGQHALRGLKSQRCTRQTFDGTHFARLLDHDNLIDSFQINHSVKYMSRDFGGLRLGGLYGFSNQAGGFANNRAYSFGMSYVWGALNFDAGYLQFNSSARTPGQLNTNGAVTDTTGSSLQGALSPTAVHLGVLASSQKTFGAGVNYTFGPAVAGFVYSHSKLTQFFQTRLSGTFQNFEGNFRYALTLAVELVPCALFGGTPDVFCARSTAASTGAAISIPERTPGPRPSMGNWTHDPALP